MSCEIVSYEPATGVEVWRGISSSPEEAVERAHHAWPCWAAQPLAIRIERVRRFVNELRKADEALTRLIARETGKPLWEARDEIDSIIARVESAISAHSERAGQRRLSNGIAGNLAIRHKPHGVMAVIGPYSQPMLAAANHIIPALIAGNAVLFKPSEKTPACGQALVRCFHEGGIPDDVLQCVIGNAETGAALIAHDRVNAIAFSGSLHAGLNLSRKLALRPDKLLTLDLGGNNPLVVWDTPLIDDAAVLVVQSAFSGAGQRRTSARRLIVSASVYEPLITAVKKLADRIIVGSPFDEPAPFMGPLIDNEAADGLTQSFIWLISNGGKPIKHMVRASDEGRDGRPFVSPSIVDVTAMNERPDVELFGPLLQVIKVHDFDAAIAEANATRFGMAAGLIGGRPEEYNRFWANIRAGIVTWNRPTNADLGAAPVGGVGLSGNHHPGGAYAADYCTWPITSVELDQPRASVGIGFSAVGLDNFALQT